MKHYTVRPPGREQTFRENDIIVSKTDLKGVRLLVITPAAAHQTGTR